jgi:hypothetical protein
MLNPTFPWTASFTIIFAVFVVCLLAFDIVLVRWFKLGKQGWKRIDYVWLGFGALGLIGAVSQARMYAADDQLGLYQARAATMFHAFRELVAMNSKSQGAACDRSTGTRAGDEYKKVCDWVRALDVKLASAEPLNWKPIPLEDLGDRPQLTLADPRDIVDGIYRQLSYYNDRACVAVDLAESAKHNEFESRFGLAYDDVT